MLGRILKIETTNKGILTTFKTLSNADFETLNKIASKGNLVRIKFESVSKRTLDQNALYWKVISDCVKHYNSSFSTKEKLHLYLLKKANVKSVIKWCDDPKSLKGSYRAIDILETVTINEKGIIKTLYICECYGSSKNLNKEQMARLIDEAILYSEILGLNKDYGEEWRMLR